MAQMEFEMVGDVMIVVHDMEAPTAGDWDAYLRTMETERRRGHLRAVIVRSPGGGPNATQRKQVAEMWDRVGGNPPVAVITESALTRAVVTALSFFLSNDIRAFPGGDLDGALRSCQLPEDEWRPLKAKIAELSHRLSVRQAS